MQGVDIGGAIAASFRFIGVAWRRAWGIMLVSVWLTAALAAIEALRPEWAFVPLLGLLPVALASTALVGALFRIGVEDRHRGDPGFRAHPAGLQWGGLEWRVLGANLIFGLIFTVAWVVVLVVWAIAFGVTAQANAGDTQTLANGDQQAKMMALLHILFGPAAAVSVLILGPALVAAAYFSTRLSLYSLAAADARNFSFAPTWIMTRGAIAAIMLTALIYFVIAGAGYLAAFIVAGIVAVSAGPGAVGWALLVYQVAVAATTAPFFAGLQLYVYDARRSDDLAATFA